MGHTEKHFKFINSKTGNTLYYHSVKEIENPGQLKAELEKIRDKVAATNGVFMETIYWEEIPDNGKVQ